jgi:hypothetical protein
MSRVTNEIDLFSKEENIEKHRVANDDLYLKAKNFVFCGILIKMTNK